MFCTVCGNCLNDQNQAGIICQRCRKQYQTGRTNKGERIQVRYCYRCGAPYQPPDASIWHCYQPLQQPNQQYNQQPKAHKTAIRAAKYNRNLTAN